MTGEPTGERYLRPGTFTVQVFNRAVAALTSGQWRSTPVNLLTVDGVRYLVAPRGITQWVRNLRAAGTGELQVGRRTEAFAATELPDADKPPILREYLRKWKWEVGAFFEGIDASSSQEDLLRVAPGFPVFRVEPVP
jgi:deazaflavin-dependent oxidoreductase (nitroreductase family)